jgi:hypothetical protein
MDEVQGWVRHGPLPTSQEMAARRERNEREARETELREAAKHAAVFGGVTDQSISECELPFSGMRFRWRADGYYRILFRGEPEHDDWEMWTDFTGASGRFELVPGDSAEPTWWQWWGTCRPDVEVHGWLADDSDVDIVRVGWLWVAEYLSRPQALFVSVSGTVHDLRPRRPAYRPPAEHPFDVSAPNPRLP